MNSFSIFKQTVTTDNKTATLFVFFLLTLGFIITSQVSASAVIIESNYKIVPEVHHDQGGDAHLKSLFTSLRTQDEHVIFLHGGDVLSPGILPTIDKKAEPIVKIDNTRLLWKYGKNQIVNKGAISPQIDGKMKALHP